MSRFRRNPQQPHRTRPSRRALRDQQMLADALRDTALALNSTLDLDEVIDRILSHLAHIIPYDTADVLLIEGDTFRIMRSKGNRERGTEDWLHNLRIPLEAFGNLMLMLRTRRPLLIPDTHQAQEWKDFPFTEWIRSNLGAPIHIEEQPIGFITLNSAKPGSFTPEHAAHLEIFASHAAIALRNAQLYSQMEQRVRERTAELQFERNRLQVLLDATGEGIIYTEGLRIQYVNPALCHMTGYTADELIGRSVAIFRRTDSPPEEVKRLIAIREALRRDELWRDEFRLRAKDGREFDAGLTISLIGAPDERLLRAVTVMRDISQEKELYAQKARFVAHASHELRTPLTNLLTRLYLLRRKPEYLDEHLAVLEEVSGRMRLLVEDLLDLSRFERGTIVLRPEVLSVQDLLASVVNVQQHEAARKQIGITLSLPDRPLTVYADRERLIQVVTNLVTNAIHYTPVGGQVCVSAFAEVCDGGGCVGLSVEDTGIGIEAKHLPHLFQPFYRVTTGKEGTGLGLTIAKEIVDLHGGIIEVESAPGKGSRFTVRLPLMRVRESMATRE